MFSSIVSAYRKAIDAYYADPVNYTFNPEWLDEVKKVSHRDYYTGFFFGIPDTGAQIYGTSSYIRDYDIVGIVLDYDKETHLAKVAQRNRFFLGDEVEIIQPMEENYTQKIDVLKDENMNDISVANHAAMTVYIKTDRPLSIDAMIRKRSD